jgi:hypothetical protein
MKPTPFLPRLGRGLLWSGAVLTLLGGFGAFAAQAAAGAGFPWPGLWFYCILAGAGAGTLGATLELGFKGNPLRLLLVFPVLLLLYFYDAIALLIGLPFILLSLILGPLALIAGIVALAMLLVYFAELAFGDIKGLSSFDNASQAVAGAGVVLLALGSLLLPGLMGDKGPLDFAAALLRRFHDDLVALYVGLLVEADGHQPPLDGTDSREP